MRARWLAVVLSSVSMAVVAAPVAVANETVCTGELHGAFDDVVVPAGKECTLIDAHVKGNVKALEGSRLSLLSSVVGGNVDGDKARVIVLLADSVGGDVTSIEAGGAFESGVLVALTTVGSDLTIEKMRSGAGFFVLLDEVRENVKIEENRVDVASAVAATTVGENLQLFKNRGQADKLVLENVVGENLQCKENEAPFIVQGNVAQQAEDQCAVGGGPKDVAPAGAFSYPLAPLASAWLLRLVPRGLPAAGDLLRRLMD